MLSRDKRKKSCLFFQVTCVSANWGPSAGAGGGSVILVIRYAVEASATPYMSTPINGTFRTTVNANAKPNRTPCRSKNHRRFCSGVNGMRQKYGSSYSLLDTITWILGI